MTQAYFITGTDTEIGKTYATCALLARAALNAASRAVSAASASRRARAALRASTWRRFERLAS